MRYLSQIFVLAADYPISPNFFKLDGKESPDNLEVIVLATQTSLREPDVETSELERRRSLGQFFTPHEVAQFIWDMAKLFHGKKWNRTARVIDPACGEGVFLHVAIEAGQDPDRCWGVDIDEFLVPVWKTDKRLRGAHLSIANGLLDTTSKEPVAGSFDLVIGNPPFSGRGLKELLQLVQPKAGKASKARSLFNDDATESAYENSNVGDEALSAHERGNLDHLVRQLNRYACWKLRDESDDAIQGTLNNSAGGLFAELDSRPLVRTTDFESMALDVAACPDDRLLDTSRPAVRNAIRRMAGTAIEVFFTERFVQLAKPGGMVAVIVPESILASDQLAPFRRWLMQEVQLLAVIGLPQKVFTGVGAKAKTGIIFARRYTEAEREANAKTRATFGLSKALLDARILLTAPGTGTNDGSLTEYLSSVMDSARNVAATNKAKEVTRGR